MKPLTLFVTFVLMCLPCAAVYAEGVGPHAKEQLVPYVLMVLSLFVLDIFRSK